MLLLCIPLVIVLSACDSLVGVDEKDSPIIEIQTAEELQQIGDRHPLNGQYVLTDDIDLADVNWASIGSWTATGSEENRGFSGIFDGRGHTIRNLKLGNTEESGIGLFAFIDGGAVENLALLDVSVQGDERVGALAGVNTGRIRNVEVRGRVEGSAFVGGVVGVNFFELERVRAMVGTEVEATQAGGGVVGANVGNGQVAAAAADVDVRGVRIIGGLVGLNDGGRVERSFARGVTSAGERVGGLVGFAGAGSQIEGAYAAVSTGGSQARGGLVGENQGQLARTYWDTDVRLTGVGVGSDAGATGLTTEEMTGEEARSNMNLDFEEVWHIVSEDYPSLRWIRRTADGE